MSVCLWCFVDHKEGTKIKAKHDKILRKIIQGKVPCELGKCAPYLCRHLVDIHVAGMKALDTNCNHLLADINSVKHNLKVLREKIRVNKP